MKVISNTDSTWPRAIAIGAGGGVVVGVLTSFGQALLPAEVASLANGAGPWSAVAFVLAAIAGAGSVPRSAILAVGAFLAMLLGYSVATVARGYAVSTTTTLFWVLAAAVAGPILGVGAAWVRGIDPAKAAVGVAALASILVGEGVYGLTVIADTTSPVFWTLQLAAGLAVVVVAALRLRDPRAVALCVALTAAGAAAFHLAYSSITGFG